MWPEIVLVVLSSVVAAQDALPKDSETDVSFVSRLDGTDQRYVLWMPEGITRPDGCAVLVALHGHGSDRWQFIQNPRDECRAVREVARKHKMCIVSPDYRAATSWMGPAAEADVLQLVEEYRKQYRPERVFLVGGSMGASSALTFAALHPEGIDGVVAMNGVTNHIEYGNFQDAIAASFGGSKKEKLDEYKKRSAEYWPERFTMPVAFTVGDKDDIVPPQSAIRLAKLLASLGCDVLLLERPEGGHETNYEDACAAIEYVVDKTARGH